MADICVVGLGHQATILGACLGEMGHEVKGTGNNKGIIESLNVDTCNLFDPSEMRKEGFIYLGIGRHSTTESK